MDVGQEADPSSPDARLGTVQQAVTNLGNQHDYLQIPQIPIGNLSTDWIPTDAENGYILSTFSDLAEGTGAWYGYTADNLGTGDENWQQLGPFGYIGAQFRWDDTAHPWPIPSNQCEVYDCTIDTFVEYSAAVKALSTDHLETAVIIAIARTDNVPLGSLYDVVALSSLDGGRTFTNARIISTGISGRHGFAWANRVDATTVVTTKVGSERDRDSTAAQIVTWYGGDVGPPDQANWWVTKILVDPATGHINLLNDPVKLPFDNETGRVSVAAYEDHQGLENVVFINSVRATSAGEEWTYFDSLGTDNDGLADCPSTDRFRIEWRYWRAIGIFDHTSFSSPPPAASINFEVNNDLLDTDENWKPCVGPSDSAAGPNYYVNDDRAVVVANRRPRATIKAAWVKTDPELGLARIRMMDRGLTPGTHPDPPADEVIVTLDAPESSEEYNPEVEIGQGSLTNGDARRSMRFALVRKRVRGENVSVEALSERWTISYSGTTFTATKFSDTNQLATFDDPARFGGTTLGLTVQPLCYHDTYGTCLINQLERLFHAAYPRLADDVVRGIAFQH